MGQTGQPLPEIFQGNMISDVPIGGRCWADRTQNPPLCGLGNVPVPASAPGHRHCTMGISLLPGGGGGGGRQSFMGDKA